MFLGIGSGHLGMGMGYKGVLGGDQKREEKTGVPPRSA